MGRIKIAIPSTPCQAEVTIPVRITDLNYGNHVGNDSMVSILHEARMQFLTGNGFTELEAGGTSLIMSDLAVSFKNESFYGDQLTIKVFSGEISGVGFALFYQIYTQRNGKDILVAEARTGMVCFNYANRKIEPVPDALKAILA